MNDTLEALPVQVLFLESPDQPVPDTSQNPSVATTSILVKLPRVVVNVPFSSKLLSSKSIEPAVIVTPSLVGHAGLRAGVGLAVAVCGRESDGLIADGGQGDIEFARGRGRGDDVVLRTNGDGQRIHVDGSRAVGILGGELEDSILCDQLRDVSQVVIILVYSGRAYAHFGAVTDGAVLRGQCCCDISTRVGGVGSRCRIDYLTCCVVGQR